MSKKIFEKLSEKGAKNNDKDLEEMQEEEELLEDQRAEMLSSASHEELIEQVNAAEKKANESLERMLRIQAENDNIRRRAERDVESAHKFALEKFANDLLPIVDSLELCKGSVPPEMQEAAKSVIDGVELTLKMFYTVMEKFAIKQVNPVSEPFDPEFQQAISVQFDPKVKPGTVVSVLQKGYTLNNRLLRPALVVVSKAEEE